MKSFKNILIYISVVFVVVALSGCEGKTDIRVLQNGGVSFEFEGNIGGTFKEMIGDDIVIDSQSIKTELLASGFTNVKVSVVQDLIKISFVDEKRKSPLFALGIFSMKGNDLSISLTPENFLALYNDCGEELQSMLDLFLSPVLNDEVMSEDEYVDTISVTYGQEAGDEIDKSVVRFSVTNGYGKIKKRSVFVKNILCGGKIYF